jgi:hypothetical protein
MNSPFIGGLKKNTFFSTLFVKFVDALILLLIFIIVYPVVAAVVFLSQVILWLFAVFTISKSTTILVGRKLNITY